MVNGVLDYSKLEAGRFELELSEVDLNTLVDDAIDQMVELAQQRKIQLRVDGSPLARPLTADALRLKQALINLLSNAIKFSEPGSVVTVACEGGAERETISVRASPAALRAG